MQKLDDEIARLNLVVPAALKDRIEVWRRKQPDLPTVSEAVRMLLEMSLDKNEMKGGAVASASPSKRKGRPSSEVFAQIGSQMRQGGPKSSKPK